MKQVNETLAQRGKHYGDFVKTFDVIQQIKDALKDGVGWAAMPPERREALEMIAVKLGRLVSGDSGHADSWHDIAGYARLVEESLSGVQQIKVTVKDEDYIRWLGKCLFDDAMNGGPLSGLVTGKQESGHD